jgi:hypothetical protein
MARALIDIGFNSAGIIENKHPALSPLVQMLRPHGKRPFVHPVILLLALDGMMFSTEGTMVPCFSVYAASGPVQIGAGPWVGMLWEKRSYGCRK